MAVLTMALLGWTHKSLDHRRSALVPRDVRLLARVAVSAIFAVIPLAHGLNSLKTLAIYASILFALVMFETIGYVLTRRRVPD